MPQQSNQFYHNWKIHYLSTNLRIFQKQGEEITIKMWKEGEKCI